MLTRRAVGALLTAAVVALAGVPVVLAPAATAGEGPCRACQDSGSSASSGGGTISVTVRGSGVLPGGGAVDLDTTNVAMHPLCWYTSFATGKEYAEFVESGRAAELDHHSPDGYTPVEGWEEHKDDDKGHWYGGECSSAYWEGDDLDGFFAASDAWFADHDTVWVDAGDAPPDPLVTPEMLAEVAFSAMKIPHGTIHWNPTRKGDDATLVGLDTWVWLEGAPTAVDVTASVYGGAIWARVDSTMTGMDVSGEGATSVRCPDGGTAWAAGATSDCTIEFERSSANQPSQTSTITARSVWESSWVSSAGGPATPLDAQTVTETAEVPVAEIQSVVSGS